MKVKELMKMLSECNQDAFVAVKEEDGSLSYITPTIEMRVNLTDNGNIVTEAIIWTVE